MMGPFETDILLLHYDSHIDAGLLEYKTSIWRAREQSEIGNPRMTHHEEDLLWTNYHFPW